MGPIFCHIISLSITRNFCTEIAHLSVMVRTFKRYEPERTDVRINRGTE